MAEIYTNRELSWLKFNERVLEEAARPEVPFCERLNFLTIYQSNLDEFFRVRVGSLVDMNSVTPEERENKTNMTPSEQIEAVLKDVRRIDKRKEEIYDTLIKEAGEQGIHIVNFKELAPEETQKLEEFFDEEIEILLSPHIVGRLQPFPFIRNCEIHAVAALVKKSAPEGAGRARLGIISCGIKSLPRLIRVSKDENRFILLENLILHCMDRIFRNYRVEAAGLIRVVRNADIDTDSLYDEGIDYREFMSDVMKHRRLMSPVRIDTSHKFNPEMLTELCTEVGVSPNAVFASKKPLDMSFLSEISKMLRDKTELFYEHRSPQRPADIIFNQPMIDQIKQKDRLFAYPYDSMQPFLRLLREAASDPAVMSIKMTLYRVAKNSQVVEYLIDAAENGKDVMVLLELKARFDEENNIAWSERLEEAGCQVMYGLNGIKVHSKLCLIVRNGEKGPEYISHIGTGNFNEVTARLYTDYSLLTANQEIGENVAAVFQSLSMDETLSESPLLLVAPKCFRKPVIKMIDDEIEAAKNGQDAYIGIKINSLTDKDIIDELAKASKAGVKIDMVVRGICCMRPGIDNETENIRVISIVGRYLEHSRIYIFGRGEREKMYIASADFMTRNTVRRVEVATPILDKDVQKKIRSMFELMLKDNVQSWALKSDGTYERITAGDEKINSQDIFSMRAYKKAAESKTVTPPPISGGENKTEAVKGRSGGFFARLFKRKG